MRFITAKRYAAVYAKFEGDLYGRHEQTIWKEFKENVNMTKLELEKWLKSDEAKSVGIKDSTKDDTKTSSNGEKSTGYKSGERIVKILDKKKDDLTDDDYKHMSKVNSYVKRHKNQKPSGGIKESRWRYSLMNWGNDPLK